MSTRYTERTLLSATIGAALAALLLILAACEQAPVTPSEPEPPEPSLAQSALTYADDVRVIEDDGSIQAVRPDAVEFARPASYVAGDVLVAGITPHTPRGLIRRVTAVSDDRLTVTTEHATLEDVIVEGALRISGELRKEHLSPESLQAIADAGIVDLSATGNQRTLLPAGKSDFLEFAFGFPKVAFIDRGHTLIVDGDFRFGITYDINFDVGVTGIRSGKFTLTPKQVVNLRVTETNDISGAFGRVTFRDDNGDLVFPLFPIPLSYSITVPTYPVPITVTPTFQLYLGVDKAGRVTFDVTGEGSVEIGAECLRDCNSIRHWKPVLEPSLQFTAKDVTMVDSLRGFMRPEFVVKVTGGLRGAVGVDLFAEAVRTASSVKLDVGLAGYADVGIDWKIVRWDHRMVPWGKPNETLEFRRYTIWRGTTGGPPSRPATPTVSALSSSSLRVTWSAPAANGASITDYDVRYRRFGASSWIDNRHNGTSRTDTISGLSSSTRYEVQVRAQNSRGESSWSPSGYGSTTGPTIRVPSRPAAPTVSALSSSSLRVTWSAPAANGASITDYDVRYRRPGASSWIDNRHNGTSRTDTISGLSSSTRYEVQVRAQNSRGESSWSSSGYGSTTGPTIRVPSRPAAPTVSALSSSSLRVTWSAPAANGASITDYDVQYRSSGSWRWKTHNGTSLSSTISGLSSNMRYEVQVRAQNSRGESSWSPSGYGTTTNTTGGVAPDNRNYFVGKTVEGTITWRARPTYWPPGTKELWSYTDSRGSLTRRTPGALTDSQRLDIISWGYRRLSGNTGRLYNIIRSENLRLEMTFTSANTGTYTLKWGSRGIFYDAFRGTFRIEMTRSVAGTADAAGQSATGAVHDRPSSHPVRTN